MKKTVILLCLLTAVAFSTVASTGAFGQSPGKDKITLTLTRNGASRTFTVSAVSYNFNKADSGSPGNRAADIVVSFMHFDRFLLEAVSGGLSNKVDAVLNAYGADGKKTRTIEMKGAVIMQLSGAFGKEYDDPESSMDIATDHLVIDGVKIQ